MLLAGEFEVPAEWVEAALLATEAKLRRQKRRNRSNRDLPSLVCSGWMAPTCSAGHRERSIGVRGSEICRKETR